MKTMILLAGLLLSVPAHADYTENGSITVLSTMAVQGNIFSVGGSTFVVAAGSITLGGRLNAAASGIKWADGTTSTSAAAGGAGDASLTANQTFSGANIFTSSVTVSATVYTSTATTGPGAVQSAGSLVGGWQIVASTNPSNASITNFSGLQPGKQYRVRYRLTKNSSSTLILRFNGNDGSNYKTTGIEMLSGDTGYFITGTGTYCNLTYDAVNNGAGVYGTIDFSSSNASDSTVSVLSDSSFTNVVSGSSRFSNQCIWFGSSPLANIQLLAGGGTFSGYVYLEQLITPLP